jgi:CcmD family protein
MNLPLIQAQEDTAAVVDTLSESYSSKWDASAGLEQAGPVMQALGSNDLIFVVLGVSLIIWLVLLFFIVRIDKKVGQLEEELEHTNVN